MISIILCDDMPVILDEFEKRLRAIALQHQLAVQIYRFSSGEELTFQMEETPHMADIIFLDVLMGRMNGIDAARKLRSFGVTAPIIFLTSSEEYVFDSFDVNPLNYLLKDHIDEEKLSAVFLQAVSLCSKEQKQYFHCENNYTVKQIPYTDIRYFEIINRLITVHYGDDSFDFYGNLKSLEQNLESEHLTDFLRIHRSFLVNLKYVDRFLPSCVVLLTGEELPLGASYAARAKDAFQRQFFH